MSQPAATPPPASLWHVTLTLRGAAHDAEDLRDELKRLVVAHGIGLSVRYWSETLELRYWDEGSSCQRVATNAVELWQSYQEDLGLPPWDVVGIEVVSPETFQRRKRTEDDQVKLFTPGVAPLER